MRCLLVRQPYASLISEGYKKIEFRSRACNIREPIAIAASKGPAFETNDSNLNLISDLLPKGKILSIASLDSSSLLYQKDLRELMTGVITANIYEKEVHLASAPLGEPILDIIEVLNDPDWWAYGWSISNLTKIETPIKYTSKAYGSWINLNHNDLENIESYL